MTYWLINGWFLLICAVFATIAIGMLMQGRRRQLGAASLAIVTGLVLLIVLLMTAVFDNLMITANLVGYDETRISGVFIGRAPIEDFAYAIAAVILLPSLWIILERPSAAHHEANVAAAALKTASRIAARTASSKTVGKTAGPTTPVNK